MNEINASLAELGCAAAGIAHDLNNQLTLILNYLEISNVEGARNAARRCSDLTLSLLSLYKGETVRPAPINAILFLSDYVETVQLPRGVSIRLDVDIVQIEIKADRLALIRMLDNLVYNACQAMACCGSLVIHLSRHAIEVTDSGPGVPPDLAERIFEPFFSTKGESGTGLGLAIVRELMRQHGGIVIFRNEPEGGATFRLQFRG